MPKPDLSVEIAGIKLQNPVLTASGTFGFGEEYGELVDLSRLGALVVKTTTLEPRPGNPGPRIVETPAGMLNAIGLQNPGVEAVIARELPKLENIGVPIIVNIAGSTVEEYRQMAHRLDGVSGIAGLEINISCPNVKQGGLAFGIDPTTAAAAVSAVRQATGLPLIVKLSPNVTDITAIARAVVEAGADALSLINTLLGLSIDINTRRPNLGNVVGGLSGPAIKPVALRMVWQVAQVVDVPIIGMGGILTAEDAVEFLLAGATAVAVGTGNFVDPRATMEVIAGLEKYLLENRCQSVGELVGQLSVSS